MSQMSHPLILINIIPAVLGTLRIARKSIAIHTMQLMQHAPSSLATDSRNY